MIIDDLPAAPDPASDAPKAFSDKAAAMVLALKNMVVQIRAAIASLNAALAGGAYSMSYVAVADSGVGAAPGGKMTFYPNSTSQAGASALWLDTKDASGGSVAAQIDSLMAGNGSAIKGTVKVILQGDPSRYVIFNITGVTTIGTYKALAVQIVSYSPVDTPFSAGNILLLQFSRTGDRGDPGTIGYISVSDVKPAGTHGGQSVANDSTQQRTLNTVDMNTIAGATLSNNAVTLPAGTYIFNARAPACGVGGHQVFLWCPTDVAYYRSGSSEFSAASGGSATDSVMSGLFTITSPKTFSIRHYTNSAVGTFGLGFSGGSLSQPNVYSQLEFEKIA
jgi:hypothetical protein